MIDKEKLTIDWINKVSKEKRNADKILVEKAIRALLLLEGLVKQNLSFVFKGGTSLMLHFNSSKRLSIDIDIILPVKQDNLSELLDNAALDQGFLRKELQHRNANSKINKEHYKFFYNPLHKSSKDEECVLLDILYEEVHYQNIIPINIQSAFLPETGTPLMVNTPSLEDLAGDKLTAFAPHTTGIPYFKHEDSMSMEIVKQLYDIGCLVDKVNDIETTKTTFKKFVKTELAYREKSTVTEQDVLDDIFNTALCIVTRGIENRTDFNELQLGVQRVVRFIFSESYHLEKAISHASKAAYLATLIKHDAKSIEKYENPMQMKDWIIGVPVNAKFNRFKRTNPESFFYWYKIFELTQKSN
ncbi:MAG: nucleotidyl transferase AbiEii/AbiGii toxin family protein [Salinivirgaceae bacterium]